LNVRDQATGNVGSLENWTLQIGNQTFQSTGAPTIPDNGNVRSTITVANPTVPTMQGVGEAAGIGGDVTVNAGTVTVQNGATMSATTRGSGQGGTLTVNATGPVALTGSGSGLFTDSEASGAGGNVNAQAARMTMDNGATVSAASSGTGDAGTITINAGPEFLSTNSSITTAATQASGGNITLLATDMIHLKNSQISSSVFGGPLTAGGNILIDPNFIILQNSQIIAQAFQGAGGRINLGFNQAFLADALSTISASSQFGVSGTVNFNSPVQNLSGALVPLKQSFLSGSTLLNQRCAAKVAEGQFSTFVVTEREGLPQEPGGILSSSLMEDEGAVVSEAAEPIRVASVSRSFFTPLTLQPVQITWTDDTCHR
jgi:large exoprotein involved in heme utilization and adhesion